MKVSFQSIQYCKFILIFIFAIFGTMLYFYSGGTLEKLIILYLMFMLINMCSTLALHRWLTHNQIKPKIWFKFFLFWTMVQVPNLMKPFHYVIAHRIHHMHADSDQDPHPPNIGFWNLFLGKFNKVNPISIRDLLKQRDLVFLDKNFWWLMILNWIIIFLIDFQIFYIMWLIHYFRGWTFVVLNNYFGHGSKHDQRPVNMPAWTVFFFLGEQLHKNHHDNPQKFFYGKEGFNIDLTYYVMKFFVIENKIK
jgi:fatty-acid desaturase